MVSPVGTSYTMHRGISEADMERIRQFTDTPPYKRGPELLLPEGETDDED